MKRLLVIILSLSIFTSLLSPLSIYAYDSNEFWYSVIDDKTARIWNYAGSMSDVTVPSTIDGYEIVEIGYPGFGSSATLVNITIPKTVKTINDEALYNCKKLESINVDENNLNYSSEQGVLFNKSKTKLISYPASKPDVSYSIPNTVTTISKEAFDYCSKLSELIIPKTVNNIYTDFNYSTSLSDIIVDNSNPYFSSRDGVLFDKSQSSIVKYPCGREEEIYTIPSGVLNLGDRAFYGSNIIGVNFSETVGYIGYESFSNCLNLKSVEIPGNVSYIDDSAFYRCLSLTNLVISEGVYSIGKRAFSNCVSLTGVILPQSLRYLWNLAFSGCENLKSVTLLNPDCTIAVCKNAIPDNSAVRGYKYTTAQSYSNTYGREFTVIDKYSVNALGASIRMSDCGMRFGFSYDRLQSQRVEEYGFVYSYSKTNDLTLDTYGVHKISASKILETNNQVNFNLVFTKIPKSAFNSILSVSAYVKIDGKYYYSNVLQRSFIGVANAVLSDESISDEIKNQLQDILI